MYKLNSEMNIQTITGENDFPMPISTDEKLLELILMSLEDIQTSIYKYSKLEDDARNQEAKDILRSIYIDKNRHKKQLEEIYLLLSGIDAPVVMPKEEVYKDYSYHIHRNIIDEIENAKFFSTIYPLFEDKEIVGVISNIINDSQNHSMLNSYLLNSN